MLQIRTLAVILASAAAATAAARALMTRTPVGVQPVTGFDVSRYIGDWFEIARLNHRFERGMSHVSASYSLNDDGTVKVVNRGRKAEQWKDIKGTARFQGEPDVASLAVTFFPGFPGGYHVFELSPDYRWAMIAGPNRGYLWILSRGKTLDEETYQRLVGIAREKGYDVDGLIRVDHG